MKAEERQTTDYKNKGRGQVIQELAQLNENLAAERWLNQELSEKLVRLKSNERSGQGATFALVVPLEYAKERDEK